MYIMITLIVISSMILLMTFPGFLCYPLIVLSICALVIKPIRLMFSYICSVYYYYKYIIVMHLYFV